MNILELSPWQVTGDDLVTVELWYAEGNSEKLEAMFEPGSTWFCFEEYWPKMALELQKIGFTATQIEEAIELPDTGHPLEGLDPRR